MQKNVHWLRDKHHLANKAFDGQKHADVAKFGRIGHFRLVQVVKVDNLVPQVITVNKNKIG